MAPNITFNGTGKSYTFKLSIAPLALGLVFSISSIVLNGFLFLVMTRERKIFFRTRVSYFVVNLALADCLTGLSLAYLELQEILKLEKLLSIKPWVILLNWTTVQCSFFSLLLMSIDRLVIILYPLTWPTILTVKRTITSIVVVWLVSISGGVLMHFYKMKAQFAVLIFVEFCTLVFVINTCCIYPVLKKREQGQSISGASSRQAQLLSHQVPHDKMSTVVIILMVVLVITQLPFVICLKIWLTHNIIDDNILQNVVMGSYLPVYLYTQTFASLNFVVNPIVYAWRLRTYRKVFLMMIKCGSSS